MAVNQFWFDRLGGVQNWNAASSAALGEGIETNSAQSLRQSLALWRGT
jgi:hypothetical protein